MQRRIAGITRGVAQQKVSLGRFKQIGLPVAPPNEQRRIVAKIEELFSDLDAGVAALERAKANLKRYRAAVLKAAVEGRLTAAWRAEHPDVEPASELLKRLLTERRKRWEQDQLAKYEAKGKKPPQGWKDRYKEPAQPDEIGCSATPERWTTASIDQLTTSITSGSRDWTKYYGCGTGTFIMAQNVRPGNLDLSFRQPVNPPENDRDRVRSQVAPSDLLVTIVGANTGDVCRIPSTLPEHYVCQSVALMRPTNPAISSFMELYLVADFGGQLDFKRYIYGQGRPHLSFDQLRMTPIVLPPLGEQRQICRTVEAAVSFVDQTEKIIDASLKRSARLRQAILKRAFRGQLVPQDPADEPAGELLARLGAERKANHAKKKSRR